MAVAWYCQTFSQIIMNPEQYKKYIGIQPINHQPGSYVIAMDRRGNPCVWALPVWSGTGIDFNHQVNLVIDYWVVTNELNRDTYMFVDTGDFGYTDNPLDRRKNGFKTPEEAIATFLKFYG